MAVNGNQPHLRFSKRFEGELKKRSDQWSAEYRHYLQVISRPPLRTASSLIGGRRRCGKCGFKVRGANHAEGSHHDTKRSVG